jgi:hypothetical protein
VDVHDDGPARASGVVCLYWLINIEAISCIWAVLYGGLRLDLAVVLIVALRLDGSVELPQDRRNVVVPGVAIFGQCFPYCLHFDGWMREIWAQNEGLRRDCMLHVLFTSLSMESMYYE